jgi:putative peptide zinc metalloprotease protein
LQATSVEGTGATTWVLKDPLTLEHFQFSAEEYALLDWMRAPATIAELQRLFQRRFSPQTITPQAIWDFLSRLHEAGLVVGVAAGQGQELLERRKREQVRRAALSWTGLLGIRFRGVDPDGVITAIHGGFRWWISPAALVAALAIVIYALTIVGGHFDEFRSRLPELSALVDWRNLPWLLLAIGAVKVLHELGHALACKHFGGEVHELGFMLLVFIPCLYCDVSDSWRLSKWRRIAVAAAGVTVEFFLAALATIVWWHAQPGAVQLVALNVMIICTLNTLIINGNPLMRYDGYYVLSDLVEVPNLWQRSREALRHFWSEWLLGQPRTEDPLLPVRQRPWLAAYAALSKVYLLSIVCVMIVFGLAKTLSPYHLQNLAYAVGLTVLGGALAGPLTSAAELARNPIRRAKVRKGRLAIVTAVALAVIVAVLAIPVDYNVSAPLVLVPEDGARVYAAVEGTLEEILPAGSKVARGETIGKLENTETQLELARLEGECRLRQLRVEHLERLRGVDGEANDQLPTARTALADSQRRLEERLGESKRLALVAPIDGVVIPPPRVPEADPIRGKLAKWSGSLLEPAARGAHVEAGTLACLVGDPNRLAAMLLVDDADVKFVQPGERARVRIEQLPGQVIEGEVVEVARHETAAADRAQEARADLSPLFAGLIAPGHEGAYYEVRVTFDEPMARGLVIGGRGDAKVATERVTLARRIWRSLAQTFRLPM